LAAILTDRIAGAILLLRGEKVLLKTLYNSS
jgi:hypothetical protein